MTRKGIRRNYDSFRIDDYDTKTVVEFLKEGCLHIFIRVMLFVVQGFLAPASPPTHKVPRVNPIQFDFLGILQDDVGGLFGGRARGSTRLFINECFSFLFVISVMSTIKIFHNAYLEANLLSMISVLLREKLVIVKN